MPQFNNNEVLLECVEMLKSHFNINNFQINQPIMVRKLFTKLDSIRGVQSVKDIQIMNKHGIGKGYSQFSYDISVATQNHVIYPSLDPSIFEVRYPDNDIKGRVVSL